ncbi:pentapeptide repeat-containing protein [Microbulbifer variabilis]|uniref:pentapeptide repeat-containing protein n=1 Tax=Microbulbifer variabilis TaxID=266805 RepID=UPI00037624A3|nr:pentapeptide repeat-containing protein [Microbulbifer variabilis]
MKNRLAGRSLWDWLQLLIVPVVLLIGGWYLSDLIERRQEKSEDKKYQRTELRHYLDAMNKLLVDYDLKCVDYAFSEYCISLSDKDKERVNSAYQSAMAMTASVIHILDGPLNSLVLSYLSKIKIKKLITDGDVFRGLSLKKAKLFRLKLDNINLSDADLSQINMYTSSLNSGNLSKVNFSRAVISDTTFNDALFLNVDFSQATIIDSSFDGAKIGDFIMDIRFENSFKEANIYNTGFEGAAIVGADFSGAKIESVSFDRAFMYGDTSFSKASVSYTSFKEADVSNVNFSNALVSHANFKEAKIETVIFLKTNLSEVNFEEAKIAGANFSRSKLFMSSFIKAKLHGSSFSEAKLRKSSFHNAELYRSDFSGADLRLSNFNGAFLNGVNFKGANLGFASFVGASFPNTKLGKIKLFCTNLIGADLSEAAIEAKNHFASQKRGEVIYSSKNNCSEFLGDSNPLFLIKCKTILPADWEGAPDSWCDVMGSAAEKENCKCKMPGKNAE